MKLIVTIVGIVGCDPMTLNLKKNVVLSVIVATTANTSIKGRLFIIGSTGVPLHLHLELFERGLEDGFLAPLLHTWRF